jgi:hypothetical protein
MRFVEKWWWWWWKGMPEVDDMNPASAPAWLWLGCMSGEAKSASAEDEPPAMAAIDESTWQSPNMVLHACLAFLKSSPARPTDRPRRSKLNGW